MFGLFGGAKWFLLTMALPHAGDPVGTLQMHEFKDREQCESTARQFAAQNEVYFACMSEDDYGALLKYGQQSPVFRMPKATEKPE